MFPATVRTLLHEHREGEAPCRGVLLDSGEVLEGLLVEGALERIGGNQDGLHELVEFLLHGGCEVGCVARHKTRRGRCGA